MNITDDVKLYLHDQRLLIRSNANGIGNFTDSYPINEARKLPFDEWARSDPVAPKSQWSCTGAWCAAWSCHQYWRRQRWSPSWIMNWTRPLLSENKSPDCRKRRQDSLVTHSRCYRAGRCCLQIWYEEFSCGKDRLLIFMRQRGGSSLTRTTRQGCGYWKGRRQSQSRSQ